MEMQNMKFDYYNSRFSYMRLIMELLNKYNVEQIVVGEIFNSFLSGLDANEIKEMIIYSSLFENKLYGMNEEERNILLNNLYECYIKSMIVNFSNNDVEAFTFFYEGLEERVKMISGYYGIYGEDGFIDYVNKTSFVTK